MTDLQNLVRQTSNPSILKMQQRLHEEVLILGKMALELKSDNEHLRLQRYQVDRDNLTISQETDEVIAMLKAGNEALQLALETERDAANLYAGQVAHWIGKHDALLEQQLVQRIEPAIERIIAGALFDFMGMLTSQPEKTRFSDCDEAGPAVEQIKKFAKKRGLSLDEADVMGWSKALPPPQPEA